MRLVTHAASIGGPIPEPLPVRVPERAALPHLSAVVVGMLFPSLGFLGPVVVAVANQSDAEVVYQARQATVFHLVVSVTAWLILAIGTLLTCGMGILPAVFAALITLTVAALTSVFAALRLLGGTPWSYPLVGRWVRPSPELWLTLDADQRAAGDKGSS